MRLFAAGLAFFGLLFNVRFLGLPGSWEGQDASPVLLNLMLAVQVLAIFVGSVAFLLPGRMVSLFDRLAAQLDRRLPTSLFGGKDLIAIPAVFLLVLGVLNVLANLVNHHFGPLDSPFCWPMSLFWLRTPAWPHLAVAGIVLGVFGVCARHFCSGNASLPRVIAFGVVLVLGTNLIQGALQGFDTPIRGGDTVHYYVDAVQVDGAGSFLEDFETIQPELASHSRTHPPGAVLAFYALHRVFTTPFLMAIALAVIATVGSGFFFHGILAKAFGDNGLARQATLLFLLIPAIQIYYAASLDALIAMALLGVLYFFLHRRAGVAVVGACACLFVASMLTFAFLYILPVLVLFEIVRRKAILRSVLVLAGLAGLLGTLWALCGFNYARSFLVASSLENPEGFRLLHHPLEYLVTRVENVAELALCFGPFLTVACWRGLRALKDRSPDLFVVSVAGVASLGAMFLTGAFRTGETARVCSFIYPYLMFPVVAYLREKNAPVGDRVLLASCVFVQAVLMQLFGHYIW